MLQLDDITYSRTATIAAVSDYYHFLTMMYMKDSQVIYPPAEGWPTIINADPDFLQSFGKSDEVLALLAHLPYIRNPTLELWGGREAEAASSCFFADWQDIISLATRPRASVSAQDLLLCTEGPSFSKLSPSHVVGLTHGGRENPIIVLDTKLGIIHWEECPARIESDYFQELVDYESDDDVGEEEADWRHGAKAWAIPDFFEVVLKAQFLKLHWIPIDPCTVWSTSWSSLTGPGREGMLPMLHEVYRQHGWPDLAAYRKSECLEAVQKAIVENYPDEAYWYQIG